jgi:hypothetical protein
MAAGAAIGGVAGGMAGGGAGEVVNPKARDDLQNHNLGTGVGTGSGAAAGAAIGAAAGPAGMIAGAAIGAAAGAAAGKGIARAVNPAVEDTYWRGAYLSAPTTRLGRTYDDYAPGLPSRLRRLVALRWPVRRLGTSPRRRMGFRQGPLRLTWDEAKLATRAAWHRVEGAMPGDFDRDGF